MCSITLTQFAYLEVEQSGNNAVFELNIGLEPQSSLTKEYLMGQRGQYVRQIFNFLPGTGTFDAERGTGYWIDGGAATWEPTISFRTGLEDVQWGDTSGGTGQGNVTTTDASGEGVKAISRLHILQHWLAKTKTDSTGAAKLHWGEWSDGSVAHVGSVSAGAFNHPMPVAVQESQLQGPDVDNDNTVLEGSITFRHVALWGGANAPDWADDLTDASNAAADALPD